MYLDIEAAVTKLMTDVFIYIPYAPMTVTLRTVFLLPAVIKKKAAEAYFMKVTHQVRFLPCFCIKLGSSYTRIG